MTHQKQNVRVSIPEMSTVIGFYRHSNLLAIVPSKLLGPIGVAILVLLLPAPGLPTHSPYPVDIIAGRAPQALVVDGRVRLVYELHLTNFAPWPI